MGVDRTIFRWCESLFANLRGDRFPLRQIGCRQFLFQRFQGLIPLLSSAGLHFDRGHAWALMSARSRACCLGRSSFPRCMLNGALSA